MAGQTHQAPRPDPPRRVLLLVHSGEAGGVQTLATEIARGLEGAGLRADTLYLFPHARAGLGPKLAGTAAAARAILGGYDAVIAFQAAASIMTGALAPLADARSIVHQTALPSEVKAPLRVLDRFVGAMGLYTANVVNSAATEAAFAAYPAAYRRALVRIDHGVAAPRPARDRAETWAGHGVPDEGLMLLNVGRLTGQKNHDVLVRALARLPASRLVVAGAGPREGELRALAGALGVADRLHLLGDVSREAVADLYGAADLFVFPSVWETFGLAAVEAALAGLPIVASDLPVLREVLAAGEGPVAAFVPPSDLESWVRAIPAQAARRPSPAARDAIRRRYAVETMVAAYLRLVSGDRGA